MQTRSQSKNINVTTATATAAGTKNKCQVCKKSYFDSGTLNRHMKSHTGEKDFKCKVCGKAFSAFWYLKRHVRAHTRINEYKERYKCGICALPYYSRPVFKRHLSSHDKDTVDSFRCRICGIWCRFSIDLKTHMKCHTGDRPYECYQCPNAYSDRSGYTRHMKIHNQDKRFKCKLCGKSFVANWQLQRHKNKIKLCTW